MTTNPDQRGIVSENVALTVILLLAVWHLLAYARVMLPSSLWVDEIISIRDFSGPGLLASLTLYPEPNNHIFFNALRSLLPFADTFDPVPARLFSFFCVLGGMGLLLHLGWREKQLIAATLLVFLLALSDSLLGTLWQVRGYGLQFFLFCLALWSLLAHARNPRTGYQIIFGICAVLSVWTATSALLFWLPFFPVLLIGERKKSWLLLLAGIVLISLLLHLPVLRDFIRVYLHYGEDHGKFFEGWNGLRLVAAQWFSVASGWLLLGLLATAPGLVYWSLKGTQNESATALRYTLYGLIGIAGSLLLGWLTATPPARVYAPFVPFLLWPLLIQLLQLARGMPRFDRWLSPTLAVAAVLLTLPSFITGKSHLPYENWKGTADWIEQFFPVDIAVHATFRPHLLALYLDPERPLADHFDAASFRSGQLIVVDSEVDGPRHDEDLRRYAPRSIRIPQLRHRHQTIFFVPRPLGPALTLTPLSPAQGFAESIRLTIPLDPAENLHVIGWDQREHTLLRQALLQSGDGPETSLPSDHLISSPPFHFLFPPPETDFIILEFDLIYAQSHRLPELFWRLP